VKLISLKQVNSPSLRCVSLFLAFFSISRIRHAQDLSPRACIMCQPRGSVYFLLPPFAASHRTQRPHSVHCGVRADFYAWGVTNQASASPKCRNLQQTCNAFTQRIRVKRPKLCQQNGLGGGHGESRTPDQRFRDWAVIPQRVCFQCLQFGRFRAVLGLVGSGTCNGSCNIKIEGRSLSSSSSRGPAAFCDGWCE
jgi:hypothetical protein